MSTLYVNTIGAQAGNEVDIADNLSLKSDASVIKFGDNEEVTLTHVHDTGLLLSDDSGTGTTQLQFGDSGTFIAQASDSNLEIQADGSLIIDAPVVDFEDDGVVLKFGDNSEVTLTHVHDTGLLLSDDSGIGTTQLQFGDSGTFIAQASDSNLEIQADGSLIIDAPVVDFEDDGVVLKFGDDAEITLTHVADTGLALKHADSGDDKYPTLTFQTGDTIVETDNKLGVINFQAPDEASDGNAVLVAAGIEAVAENTFASGTNMTKLVFKTAEAEVATEKITMGSGGSLNLVTDGPHLKFGIHGEIRIIHVHDEGLILKNTNVGDNTPFVLTLKSEENEILAGEVIGAIDFKGGDSDGSDAVRVCAGIEAVATDTHAADNNSAKLSFKTATTEDAAEKMALSNSGDLSLVKDSSVFNMGAGNDFTITHDGTTGATIAATPITVDSGGALNLYGTSINVGTDTDVAIDIDSTTLDIDASDAITIDGTSVTVTSDTSTFTSANSTDPLVTIKNTTNDANGARLRFVKDKGAAGADGDDIGVIEFVGDDAAQTQTTFAKIVAEVSEADDTDEAGKLSLYVAESDGTNTALTAGLVLEGEHATDGQVDVTIGAGSASTTSVVGGLTVASAGITATKTAAALLNGSAGATVTPSADGGDAAALTMNSIRSGTVTITLGGNLTADNAEALAITVNCDQVTANDVIVCSMGQSGASHSTADIKYLNVSANHARNSAAMLFWVSYGYGDYIYDAGGGSEVVLLNWALL